MDLLPPRISDPELFALLVAILSVGPEGTDTAGLRLRLIDRKTSWQALVDLANRQGVIFPLIWALTRRSLMLPLPRKSGVLDHPTTRLQTAYCRHLERKQAQRSQLAAITTALNRVNIAPLLLKGARYLMAPVGPWCEARDMRDIDILVRTKDLPQTADALQRAGYEFEPGFVPIDQHLPELWLAGQPSAVEVHSEALAFSGRKILATDEVWQHAYGIENESGSFFVLPNEWHLLHCLLNHQITDRGHVRRMLNVKPLWEFAMLASELPDRGWRAIVDHLAAKGQADVLASWIAQAARLFGLTHPQWIDISPAARTHADRTFVHAAAPQWLRRGRLLADQLRFAFGKETLAVRYGVAESEVSLRTVGRHLLFLTRRYRGRMIRRLIGDGNGAT